MPATQNLHTAVERSAPPVITRCEEDGLHAWHDVSVDDLKHVLLVSPCNTVFQFDVVVITFQFQNGILAHLTYHGGNMLVGID